MIIRKSLVHFVEKMETELIANDHKPGWIDSDENFEDKAGTKDRRGNEQVI